tara:strand:+ start:278 stop:481 length:204 start_codon:yes stop_codon:yes gene_type:complete
LNERIEQLALRANLKFDDLPDGIFIPLEKFVELIVEECAELFPLVFTDEQYQRRIDKTIKKHFGIIK